MPNLPGDLPAPKPVLITIAVWAISILALISGMVALTRGSAFMSIALIVLGALGLSSAILRIRQSRLSFGRLRFDQRGLAAALSIGIVVGFAQTIPLVLMPALFEYALDYGQRHSACSGWA